MQGNSTIPRIRFRPMNVSLRISAAPTADIDNVSRWGVENMIKNMEEKKNFQL
jgi:hypothetical protein